MSDEHVNVDELVALSTAEGTMMAALFALAVRNESDPERTLEHVRQAIHSYLAPLYSGRAPEHVRERMRSRVDEVLSLAQRVKSI